MADPVFCAGAGFLVGMGYPLTGPAEPALGKEAMLALKLRGCAHLHCLSCDQPIKIWDDAGFKIGVTVLWIMKPAPGEMKRDLEEIERTYDAADPNPGIVEAPGQRAYSCRCLRIEIREYESLAGTNLPHNWRCCGHPA